MVAEAPTLTSTVLPDVPAVEDKLNFGPYARTLLDIILNPGVQTPLTIGIFGSWGSGKTSLMRMVEVGLKRVARDDQDGRQTFAVWFNAWLYSKEETLWRALVVQVLAGVRRIRDLDATARAELDALADQLYRTTGPSELGHLSIAAAELLREEGAGAAQITLALQHGLDFLENIAVARQQGELAAAKALRDQVRRATAALEQERIESLERFQTQFETVVRKHILPRGLLVIFVDDLDRCLPDKAVEVLEAIKLFLDVPGCVFILGIDRDVIERGIRLRYGELGGMGDGEAIRFNVDREVIESKMSAARYRAFLQELYTGADDVIDGGRYLEKIVQIPFVLPPISPQAMGRFVAELTPNLPDARCGLVFVRGLEPNPRQVKRALNIFALLWALAQNQPYLANRISPVRLAKLVVLQQRHAELYEKVRQDPSLLIAWERAFRVRRDRAQYQEWAQTSDFDWQSANSLWALEAPFPPELEVYEDRAALESLLIMHSLTGESAEEANFVDMTPQEVHDLIFLAYTAESGAERPVQEPVAKQVETAVPDVELEVSGPVPLQELLRFSEEEVSWIVAQALTSVGKVALTMERDEGPVNSYVVDEMIETGRFLLNDWLRGAVSPEVMATLTGEARTVQVLFQGHEGSLMARLPWEMVYDRQGEHDSDVVALKDFWGGRHVIERPLALAAVEKRPMPQLAMPPLEGEAPRVRLVLDWGIDAGPAVELFETWTKPAGAVLQEPIEDPEAFYQSLQDDPAEVYVIYGRGWQEVGEGVIGIGKGYPLRTRELLSWAANKAQPKSPLLFYLCLQGDPTQELDWSAWLSAFQQLGAKSVVAPLIYTPGQWSLLFMGHFFDPFLDGEPVGEALREARLNFFEETGNPLGLLYVHFGPSALRLSLTRERDDGEAD